MLKNTYLKTFFWIIRLQWRTSKFYSIWTLAYNLARGTYLALTAYAGAQVIDLASRIVLQGADIDPKQIYFWLGITLIITIVFAAGSRYSYYSRQKMQVCLGEAFAHDLMAKVYSLSQEQLEDEEFSLQFSRAKDGAKTIWDLVVYLTLLLAISVSLLIALVVLFLASPLMALIVSISLIPIIILQWWLSASTEKLKREIDHDWRVINNSVHQLTDRRYMFEIRLLNAFKSIAKRWRRSGERIEKSYDRKIKIFLPIHVLSSTIHPLVTFFVSIYFIQMLLNGQIELAGFIFLQANLKNTVSTSNALTSHVKQLQTAFIDLNNFIKIKETPPAIPDGNIKVKSPLKIELIDVNFKYPKTDNLVLKNISFNLNANDHLALVGSNGAGKTTLVKLIMRQYLPTSGQIKINGYNIEDLNLDYYYNLISQLGQEFFLSGHLTIKENLLLGINKPMTNKKIWQALQLAEAEDFVNNLPTKLGSRLEPSFEDGINLSTGQRQRLCVSRSLLKQSSLLILDEPTSAIDAKTESRIFDNIYSNQTGKGIIVISHRFSTVRRADKILMLDKGRIVEQGSHSQLMKANGLYREIFEIQAEGYRN